MGKRILVLGGYGTLGRHVSQAVVAIPGAECVIGARRSREARNAYAENSTVLTVDVNDPGSVRRALEGVFAVVNAVGPSHAQDYGVAETCAGLGIHYIDLAEARAYVDGISRLNRRAQQKNCLIVSGVTLVPAVAAALVDMLAPEFDRISEIHTCVSSGNKNPRSPATMRAILGYAGLSLRLKENGRWRYAYGWGESQKVIFPKPVGKRRVYLSETPDLDLFPARYGAQTVTSRTGLELNLFNRGLALLGLLRRWGWMKNLPAWAPALNAASHLFRSFGGMAGGMRVLVRGRRHGEEIEHTAFLIARDASGPAIACAPASALVRHWIERGVNDAGAMPCIGLLTWDEIKAELLNHDIRLVRI